MMQSMTTLTMNSHLRGTAQIKMFAGSDARLSWKIGLTQFPKRQVLVINSKIKTLRSRQFSIKMRF